MAIETHGDERLETPQVRLRPVLYSALGALLLLALSVAVLRAVYYWQVPVQSFPAPAKFPQPRVETGQRAERDRLAREQNARLSGYHWVDRNSGIIQIPIARAMQILAAEGASGWAPLASPQALSAPGAGAERLTTPQAAAPAAAPASPPPPAQNDNQGTKP